jgi:hypothetical protein
MYLLQHAIPTLVNRKAINYQTLYKSTRFMSGDAATLFSGVAWTRGGQCTGPTLASRPFFPGLVPQKSRPFL